MKQQRRVGVVGVPGGWSSERLADALERRTGFRLVLDIAEVSLVLDRGEVLHRGENLLDLDGLILKKVGTEYSPEHLDRLYILRYARERGLPVFSDPARVAQVLDRMACTIALQLSGAPMPPTVITEDVGAAANAVRRFRKAVFKPLFSTKARGMMVIEDGADARARVEEFKQAGNTVMYVQKMQELPGQDLGVTFLGGEYLGTYARVAGEGAWNTTHRAGGRYESYEPSAEIVDIARRAQAPFGLDFTCVDVAETDSGPVVWEVSAFGGFHGLLDGCGIDVAERYADYVLEKIRHG